MMPIDNAWCSGFARAKHFVWIGVPGLRTSQDSARVARLKQRTDGEAQLVHASRVEKRTEQRRTAFTEHPPQPALRERVEHNVHVERLLSTHQRVRNPGERSFLHVR
jgi:hypothetical protein